MTSGRYQRQDSFLVGIPTHHSFPARLVISRLMKSLHVILCSLLLVSASQAQWKTTSYSLKGGWNSIYLNGDAPPTALEDLLPAAVTEVWRWNPNPTQVQFTESPLIPSAGTAEWSVWKRGLPAESSLSKLTGQAAYLVKCSGTTADSYAVDLKLSPEPPRNSWVRNGANLLGFPSLKSGGSYPTLSSYFATFPVAIAASSKIYKYVGGDLGAANPLQVFSPASERLDATKAYWFSAEVAGDFYAPFEISSSTNSGLAFGREGSVVVVRIRNRTAAAATLTFSPVSSESAPARQTAIAGPVPLTRRSFNAVSLAWTETPISAAFSEAIGPQSTVEFSFGINRGDGGMSGAAAESLFASLLRITDSGNLIEVHLPVSAQQSSLAGLWMGDISLTHVSNKVSNVAQASASLSADSVSSLAVTGSGGFGYTSPPLVTIAAPHANGSLTATASASLSSSGGVNGLNVLSKGSNYTNAPDITISSPPPSVSATAEATTGGGGVASVTAGIAGTNYSTPPTVTVAPPPAAVQATAVASVAGGGVTAVTTVEGGGYYPSVPLVTISAPPAGVTATATAGISNATGALSSISVVEGGSYYTSSPTVTFSAATRTTATATAAVSGGSVSSITKQAVGGWFPSTALPVVTVSAPPASVTALGTAVRSGSAITSITVTTAGGYYTSAPSVTFSGSGGATATAVVADGVVTEVTITKGGSYTSTPTVTFSAPPARVTAIATAGGWLNGGINSYTVTNGGKGYFTAPTVTVAAAPVGTSPTATASVVNGRVTQLTINTAGSGYLTAPTVTLAAPPRVQATATVALSRGRAWTYTVSNPGEGYSEAPTVTIAAPPSIVQATATSSLSAGGVVSYTITDPGMGYRDLDDSPYPLVSVAAPLDPVTAIATALISNGAVSGFVVREPGTGYTAAPSVTIATPPANTQATATATVGNGSVTGFTITSGGSGYEKSPVVTIAPPPLQSGTATASRFKLRTLLHLSDGGVASLLPQVFTGQLAVAPHDVGLSVREGALKQDSLASAQRYSAAHLPLDQPITSGSGSVAIGDVLTRIVTVLFNDPTNPFVHAYHPDHDNKDARGGPLAEAPTITRTCKFTFTAAPPAGSGAAIGWGSSVIGGTYEESMTGIYKDPLILSGTFELRRASEIGTLTP